MSRLFLAIALLLQAASALKLAGAVTRRGAITSAAAAAVGIATPAFANSGELNAEKVIEGFMEGPKAKEGALLPKVVVESSGAKSTSLQIIGKPSSEKGDFCDYIWFSGKTGDTLFQQQFRSNGKSTKEAASADATVQTPKFKARFNKGATVVPFVHYSVSGTFQGDSITI